MNKYEKAIANGDLNSEVVFKILELLSSYGLNEAIDILKATAFFLQDNSTLNIEYAKAALKYLDDHHE